MLSFEDVLKEFDVFFANGIYKIRRLVLVNLDIFDEDLDTFRM